jgi:hypothetical protein
MSDARRHSGHRLGRIFQLPAATTFDLAFRAGAVTHSSAGPIAWAITAAVTRADAFVARAVARAITPALAVHEFRSAIQFAELASRAIFWLDKIRIVTVRDAVAVIVERAIRMNLAFAEWRDSGLRICFIRDNETEQCHESKRYCERQNAFHDNLLWIYCSHFCSHFFLSPLLVRSIAMPEKFFNFILNVLAFKFQALSAIQHIRKLCRQHNQLGTFVESVRQICRNKGELVSDFLKILKGKNFPCV